MRRPQSRPIKTGTRSHLFSALVHLETSKVVTEQRKARKENRPSGSKIATTVQPSKLVRYLVDTKCQLAVSGCVAPSSGLHQAPSRAQANQGDATPYPLTRVLAPPQFHLAEPHFASRNFNPSRPRGWQSLPLRIPSIRKRGRERPLPMLVVMGSFLCNSELPVLASVERPPAHAIELTNVDPSETRAPLATWACCFGSVTPALLL